MTVRASGAARSVRHPARRAKARGGDAGGRIALHRLAVRAADRIARIAPRRLRPAFEAKPEFTVRGLH